MQPGRGWVVAACQRTARRQRRGRLPSSKNVLVSGCRGSKKVSSYWKEVAYDPVEDSSQGQHERSNEEEDANNSRERARTTPSHEDHREGESTDNEANQSHRCWIGHLGESSGRLWLEIQLLKQLRRDSHAASRTLLVAETGVVDMVMSLHARLDVIGAGRYAVRRSWRHLDGWRSTKEWENESDEHEEVQAVEHLLAGTEAN